MSHETVSCLTQSLLSTIEEEDDGGYQSDLRVGNEDSGCFQHDPNRRCTVRCTCQSPPALGKLTDTVKMQHHLLPHDVTVMHK